MAKKKLTTKEIWGIDAGQAFLLKVDLKELGVETTWNVIENTNAIKHVITSAQEMGKKLHADFYEEDEKSPSGFKLKAGTQKAYDEAETALNDKVWELDLKPIPFEKIKDLKGITGTTLLQLQPILTR